MFRGLLLCLVICWTGLASASVSFEVCYDFGCRNSSEVTLSEGQWNTVKSLFDAADPAEERILIKLAVGHMEYLAGIYTPTHRDIAGNLLATEDSSGAELFPGQLDCIDESINTSRYLALFEAHGLLRFHRYTERVYRRSVLTQHWATAFEELESGKQFVVDSWFSDNGDAPIVVSRSVWQDLSR